MSRDTEVRMQGAEIQRCAADLAMAADFAEHRNLSTPALNATPTHGPAASHVARGPHALSHCRGGESNGPPVRPPRHHGASVVQGLPTDMAVRPLCLARLPGAVAWRADHGHCACVPVAPPNHG